MLKLVQEVLITGTAADSGRLGLPDILQGRASPTQFHRPDVGKRLRPGTPTHARRTPDATVMLIAMAGGGARADMVLVVGDAATSGRAL